MIVTRGLGKGGSKFGALVSYGLGIDYVSSSGFLAEIPLWALNLSKYDPAVTWDGSVFLFLPKADLTLRAEEVSALKTNSWLSKPSSADLVFNNYGLEPLVKTTANVWFKPNPLGLNLNSPTPTSTLTNNYIGKVPEKYLSLASNAPSLSVTAGYLSRVATKALTLSAFEETIVSDHKLIPIGTKALTLSVNNTVVKATANILVNPNTGELALIPRIPTVTGIGYVVLNVGTGTLSVFGTGSAVLTGNYLSQPNSANLSLQDYDPTLSLSNNYLAKVLVSNLELSKQNPSVVLSVNELIKIAAYQLHLNSQAVEGKVSDHKNLVIETASLTSNWLGVTAETTGHFFSKPAAKELLLGVISPDSNITQDYLVRVLAKELNLEGSSFELGSSYTGEIDTILLNLIANIANLEDVIRNRIQVTSGTSDFNVINNSVSPVNSSIKINKEELTSGSIMAIPTSTPSNRVEVISVPDKIRVSVRNTSKILGSSKPTRIDIK